MPGTLVRKSWSVSIWPRWLVCEAGLVEGEPFGVRPAADRDEHDVGLDRLGRAARGGLDGQRRPCRPCARALVTLVESLNSKPCFLKILLASLRTSPSKPGRIWSRNSTTVTLRAEPPPHRAELEPDHAAADHDHALGHLRQLERAGGIDDPLLVDLDAGQRSHRRAGGDDDVLRAHGAVADLDRVGALEARAALQPFDLVLLEQELDALGQALHRFLALAVHRVEVELDAA